MKYRTVKDNAGRFAVHLMYSALEISAFGYYAWLTDRRARERKRIEDYLGRWAAHRRSRRSYGDLRITRDLRDKRLCVVENRVARLMRAAQIRAKSVRKWRATTKSSHRLPVAENVLNRAFRVTQPDRVWPGDTSYVWTAEGWLYLAVVLDLYSRAVIGQAMSERLTTQLPTDALTMAL